MEFFIMFFLVFLLISFAVSPLIAASIIIPILVVRNERKYESFVNEHSVAIKSLKKINECYKFHEVPNFDMSVSYDHDVNFDNVSTLDYLTYQMQFIKKDEIFLAIDLAYMNKNLYQRYSSDVNSNCRVGEYDTEPLPSKEKLSKYERRIINSLLLTPTTEFTITVTITKTNVNGIYKGKKYKKFNSFEIEEIIKDLGQKNGRFYTKESVWQSICRVERAKVSLRTRFAILKKSNYRCRICGRKTDDLEIDHIFPISKGGKTTPDNLQALCHRCNSEKSNKISSFYGNVPKRPERAVFCGRCGAKLVLMQGKNGKFYGCPNYPKCK